jgi:ribonucleoside-triphosphate reductase
VAVIFQIQSLQQFGGVSATHIDWSMLPYVRLSFYKHFCDGLKYVEETEDETIAALKHKARSISITDKRYKAHTEAYNYAMDMTVKETYQAVEGMYHNLNTLQSRSGNQLPFSSINYGTCTEPEGRLIIKALLDTSIKGIGKLHRTSIFPCGIFQYMKGVNDKGSPNYDLFQLAIKSTAKRLYPNYANCDVSMQKAWIEFDRRQKELIINSLSENETSILIERLETNPELKELLMLEVIDDGE